MGHYRNIQWRREPPAGRLNSVGQARTVFRDGGFEIIVVGGGGGRETGRRKRWRYLMTQ